MANAEQTYPPENLENKSSQAVVEELETDPDAGLREDEARKRIERYGENTIAVTPIFLIDAGSDTFRSTRTVLSLSNREWPNGKRLFSCTCPCQGKSGTLPTPRNLGMLVAPDRQRGKHRVVILRRTNNG